MPHGSPRSLRHEYELFVEREIENYKESVPRSALLSIGDEAVAVLASQPQLALTEVLLCEEVDRIIRRRLGLPAYQGWRRRRLKELEELRRPEHWGLRPDDPFVSALRPSAEARVLVAGASDLPALYLAAHGFDVTTLDDRIDAVERILDAAAAAGLSERIHACVADLASAEMMLADGAPLAAVIFSSDAFSGMNATTRNRLIRALQGATSGGGVHLISTGANGDSTGGRRRPSLDQLRKSYRGWEISIGPALGSDSALFARKVVA